MGLLSFVRPQVLDVIPSKINGEIKVIESFGKKTLYVGGAEQSGGTIVSMWTSAVRAMRQFSNLKMGNCLVLGLGGGTIITILKSFYPQLTITVVEIDPCMLEIAEKYFKSNLPPLVKVTISNAFSFIKKKKLFGFFDLVVVDLYIGKLNPERARRKDFLMALKKLLKENGSILYNSHYEKGNEEDYQNFLKVCKKQFLQVEEILKYPYSRILLFRSHE